MAMGVSSRRLRVLQLTLPGTYGEAIATKAFVEEHAFETILVVTSPYHARRSLATFRSVLKPDRVMVGIAPATASSPARPERWWATPYDRAYVRYEWAAIAYYALRHGILSWA